ncbi:hypothetical protein M433DRAFT_144912 [Acidomyces richmondensis BFW]|nr:MAG: hypothetical protein FE78DRAFT_81627 [Acidomyces sp. 'richmondensis']KYG44426.1 hypothetical protein M433DRAFT_144912 [Acidomyces richmondensis BFW]
MAALLDPKQLIHSAKVIAVPIPFFLAGYSFACSYTAVPALYDQKAEDSTPPFVKLVFLGGGGVVLPSSVLSAAASAYLAYVLPSQRSFWATAAGALLVPPIWTGLVMKANISRLIEISKDKSMQEKATANLEARQRLIKWTKQNYVRVAAFMVAGIAAVRATVAA